MFDVPELQVFASVGVQPTIPTFVLGVCVQDYRPIMPALERFDGRALDGDQLGTLSYAGWSGGSIDNDGVRRNVHDAARGATRQHESCNGKYAYLPTLLRNAEVLGAWHMKAGATLNKPVGRTAATASQ